MRRVTKRRRVRMNNFSFCTDDEIRAMIKEERERGERPNFVNEMLDREVINKG